MYSVSGHAEYESRESLHVESMVKGAADHYQ